MGLASLGRRGGDYGYGENEETNDTRSCRVCGTALDTDLTYCDRCRGFEARRKSIISEANEDYLLKLRDDVQKEIRGRLKESPAKKILKDHLGPAQMEDAIARLAKLIPNGVDLAATDPVNFLVTAANKLEAYQEALLSRKELEFLADFKCEHIQWGGEPCSDAEDIGVCCGSCWVSFWAKQRLEKEIYDGK